MQHMASICLKKLVSWCLKARKGGIGHPALVPETCLCRRAIRCKHPSIIADFVVRDIVAQTLKESWHLPLPLYRVNDSTGVKFVPFQ